MDGFTDTEKFFRSGIDAVAICSPAPCHLDNVRDAARLLLGEEDIHIELLVPADVAPDGGRRNSLRRSPRGKTPSIV